jgi:tetratricopeptide (TPR) repeat protein
LKGQGFELIAAAQDTGGDAAAGKWYEAAKATYTTLVDTAHTVSSAYQLVNVPAGIWIDEKGRVVRPPETASPKNQELKIGGKVIRTEGDAYVAALRDWVAKGDKSEYVLSDEEYRRRVKERSPSEKEAEASFKLAIALHEAGQRELASKWWQRAQTLNPESWNYHRQDWSFTPDAGKKWMEKFQQSTGDYYPKLELKEKQ